ncbi:hypothetical protein DL98DRAFT_602699 [Cadophora sp. DSE1049]|nr:hypothetical protein DL98DRAFT_602699 [Cadophora sp. DSE1049]
MMLLASRTSENFILEKASAMDLQITSLVWGITLGLGFLTTWKAIKQTTSITRRYGYRKLNSPYIWMIWIEILSCLGFSIMSWLYLNSYLKPNFSFFFIIHTGQQNFASSYGQTKNNELRFWVALLPTCIAISVYCVWIPAQLQVSEEWKRLNRIWDRCEKVLYLLIDVELNWYFVRTVHTQLVSQGLLKYKRLIRFNMWMVGVSLGTDVLIIAMMSLKNSFAYMQFHPLAYTVKLKIEISMAELIAKIAKTSMNHKDRDCYRYPSLPSRQSIDNTTFRKPSLTSETSPAEDWKLIASDPSSPPFDIESVEAYYSIQTPRDV